MGKTKTIPSLEYSRFEKMCKAICGRTAYGVIVTTAKLEGEDYSRLKKGHLPTVNRLNTEKEKGASIVQQFGLKAEYIRFIIEHGIFPYYLYRLDDTMSTDDWAAFQLDMETQYELKIGRNVWKKWINTEETIPDNIADSLTEYFMVSKETLLDYKSLKKDFREIFAEYLAKVKPEKIRQYMFTALNKSKRTIIINDRGNYTLLSGTDMEFEMAVKRIKELNLKDFLDDFNSDEYEAQTVSNPQPENYLRRNGGPLKTQSGRPKETNPDSLELMIESIGKRLNMNKDDLNEELE